MNNRIGIYARNLCASWVGYGANLVVLFFLSPFIVHSLGDVRYGIWSLIVSLTGYLGLIEFGTQAGIGRFINFYLGKQQLDKVNAVASTGMAIFVFAGLILLAVTAGIVALLPSVFPKIPESLITESRMVCVIAAFNLWLSLLSAPARLVIRAKERFELTNAVNLVVLLVRAGGTVFALSNGMGLVALSFVQLATSLLGLVSLGVVAHRVMPELSIRRRLVTRDQFRELFSFSIWAFVGCMGYRLLSCSDAILIAMLLGPKWVTIYAIGDLLVQRSAEAVNRGVQVFAPKLMQDCASEDFASLRTHYRRCLSVNMGIAILLSVGMLGFAREFIQLWMGPEFDDSFIVLAILATSWLFSVPFAATLPIYSGLNRVKLSSVFIIVQAIINLVLSVILVSGFELGVPGIAWGTFFPRILVCGIGTVMLFKMISLPIADAVRDALRWGILSAAFYGVCLVINQVPLPSQWSTLVLKVFAAVVCYIVLAWVLLLVKEERQSVKRIVSTRVFDRLAKKQGFANQ